MEYPKSHKRLLHLDYMDCLDHLLQNLLEYLESPKGLLLLERLEFPYNPFHYRLEYLECSIHIPFLLENMRHPNHPQQLKPYTLYRCLEHYIQQSC